MAEVSHEATVVALPPPTISEDASPAPPEEVSEIAKAMNNDKPEETEGLAELDTQQSTNEIQILPPPRLDDEALHIPAAITMDRKEYLLKKARADRLAWIQSVPLPYSTDDNSILDATHIIQELPSANKILSSLYGTDNISTRLEALIPLNSAGSNEALRHAKEVLEDERHAAEADVRNILSEYQAFTSQLERPESAVIVNSMRHFLHQMGTDPASSLRNQVATTLEQLKRVYGDETWSKRSLESFLYGHAQKIIISTLRNEKKRDMEFLEKLKTLSFVTAKHLDLTCFLDDKQDYLVAAVSTLLSIQNYYSPFEKLKLILKTYHCVNEALTKAQAGKIPSADDVLPTLIWVVLQAKPLHLVSNLAMIETYAPPEYLRGEEGYAYTNLYGAVQFLADLNLSANDDDPMTSLTITPQDFRLGLEKSRTAMEAQLTNVNKQKELVVPAVEPAKTVVIPVSEVRAARLRGEIADLDWARQRFMSVSESSTTGEATSEEQVLPTGFSRNYSFLTSQPDEIRLKDLPLLLQEYKMLVRTTETLLAERAQRASQQRKESLIKVEKAIQENAIEAELGLFGSGGRRK